MTQPLIVWFRQDLRLHDNPAFLAACETGHPILPVYILDDYNSGKWKMGEASRWWLHESLSQLNHSLNNALIFRAGSPLPILEQLAKETNASAIFWNRCYEPWRIARDKIIKKSLPISRSFNGSLLFEPQNALKEDGTPYKVFTPFYQKGCLNRAPTPQEPKAPPAHINLAHHDTGLLKDLNLLPRIQWYKTMQNEWKPGEQGAQERFREFTKRGLKGYKQGRDFPNENNVSRLSPHLHFGEISPRHVWHTVQAAMIAQGCEQDGEHFMRELGWREFSNSLLFHFPELPEKNLQHKFNKFPWNNDEHALKAWQSGKTGYPIVDAGMRELWQTGYMHNRVRMIVGSFLVKNLLLHWHHGEEWFWNTLVDANLANNSASWQWIAGCGADAAPYFRIFNPVTQGKKFDPDGAYVRRYVPELSALPDKFLHCPWEAPDQKLQSYGITLGETYPRPIIDLKSSRERALEAFKQL